MKLIIGGAYQGKLDHAKTAFNISEADVFTCCDTKVDFNSSCIYHLERFALACVRENKEPKEIFAAYWERFKNLLTQCPTHGHPGYVLIQIFYQGGDGAIRSCLDNATNYEFVLMDPESAWALLNR